LLSTAIIQYYYTQLIGNPLCPPTLIPTTGFTGFGLIDGDTYGANGLAINPVGYIGEYYASYDTDEADERVRPTFSTDKSGTSSLI